MDNNIYMITIGQSTSRQVLISAPKYAIVLFRHEDNELSIWSEGLTAEEGRELVLKYKKGNVGVHFGKAYRKMLREHQTEGFSERGTYDRKGFINLLSEFGLDELKHHAGTIYNAIFDSYTGIETFGDSKELKVQPKEVAQSVQKIYIGTLYRFGEIICADSDKENCEKVIMDDYERRYLAENDEDPRDSYYREEHRSDYDVARDDIEWQEFELGKATLR